MPAMEEVAFFAGAIGALGGAIAVIALRNPFYSVLALVVHLVSVAGLFLILHAEFVAAAQVVVYAGAVMVLYVFVTAYVGGVEEPLWEPIPGQRFLGPLLALALFIELSIAVLGTALASIETEGATIELGFGSPESIGELFLERFLIAFEAASMLLLIAAVGAVVLAGRRPGGAVAGSAGILHDAPGEAGEQGPQLRGAAPAEPASGAPGAVPGEPPAGAPGASS
jgi:NADH:ubiquinone oxidoreductase subunit 6 (subunit J)